MIYQQFAAFFSSQSSLLNSSQDSADCCLPSAFCRNFMHEYNAKPDTRTTEASYCLVQPPCFGHILGDNCQKLEIDTSFLSAYHTPLQLCFPPWQTYLACELSHLFCSPTPSMSCLQLVCLQQQNLTKTCAMPQGSKRTCLCLDGGLYIDRIAHDKLLQKVRKNYRGMYTCSATKFLQQESP